MFQTQPYHPGNAEARNTSQRYMPGQIISRHCSTHAWCPGWKHEGAVFDLGSVLKERGVFPP